MLNRKIMRPTITRDVRRLCFLTPGINAFVTTAPYK